jgi:hypothetical protein
VSQECADGIVTLANKRQCPNRFGLPTSVLTLKSGHGGRVRPALLRRKHYDRAAPGLYRANQIMFVANDALAAVRKGWIGVRGKKRVEFDLNRPHEKT